MMTVEYKKILPPPHSNNRYTVAFSHYLHQNKRKLIVLQEILSGKKPINRNILQIDAKLCTIYDLKTALHTVNPTRNILQARQLNLPQPLTPSKLHNAKPQHTPKHNQTDHNV